MRTRRWLSAAATMMLVACTDERAEQRSEAASPAPANAGAASPAPIQPRLSWDSVASGEGTALRLLEVDGRLRMSVACLARSRRLLVNVPSFAPIGSEERFAFAVGEEPVTLVADPTRQQGRPGVTGDGPIPANLGLLMRRAESIGALYGAQQIGPHAPPPAALVDLLVAGCADMAG